MYYRWIPLFSSLTLTGLIGGLWWYALESTTSTPTWVPASSRISVCSYRDCFCEQNYRFQGRKNYLPDRNDAFPCGIRVLLFIFPAYNDKHFWVYSNYSRLNSRESSRGLPLPGWFSAKVNISLLSGRGKLFGYPPIGGKPRQRWWDSYPPFSRPLRLNADQLHRDRRQSG